MKLITVDNLKHFKKKLEELNATKEELANIVPVGVIYPFGGDNSKVPIGYLPCDGRAVSRTQYSALFNVIGTSFGNGDKTSTFNVPDMRECVLVGIGTRGSGVAIHDPYTLGQFKDDQMQGHKHDDSGHNHSFTHGNWENASQQARPSQAASWGTLYTSTGYANLGLPTKYSDDYGTPRTGKTTHGKQLGVNYIIKY